MKRLLSSIIALTLGLGAVPVQAQTAHGRASLLSGMTAPVPVPAGIASAAGSVTPTLSAAALTVSPAPFAPLAAGILAASAPVLWGAAPALKYVYAVLAADQMMLAIILPLAAGVAVWRKLRSTPQTGAQPPPSRRAKLAVIAAGVILGLGVAAAPYYVTGPVVERVTSIVDRGREADKRHEAHWLRGGVIRLPAFFISRQDDSHAQHEKFFDGVYLAETEITRRGWTVEQVLESPELQRPLARLPRPRLPRARLSREHPRIG
ncbi:MAG: hypothetical protein Q8T11_09845 [Elusimicrobiota bacterium]|nr:hypothetical protein [Elusimicrobiota bacterium]